MYRHGHYGAALLLSAPGVVLLGPAAGLAFSAISLVTSTLPDLDTRTEAIRHRGVTHTVAFAVVVAVAGGLFVGAGWLFARFVGLGVVGASTLPAAVLLVAVGCLVGICSHLLADVLTPGYGTNAMRPLWPASGRTIRLGIARVDSPAWNWGLLVAGLLAQLAALSVAGGFG